MKFETVQLSELREDPANVRQHDHQNLAAIKESLQRFGQQLPIVVDGNNVVAAGNGRLRAMRELGWTEAQVTRTSLTGDELRAFSVADNRTGDLSSWNASALAVALQTLRDEDADLATSTGFSIQDIEAMIHADEEGSTTVLGDDAVPPVEGNAATSLGEVYVLGRHRLAVGDARDKKLWETLLRGEKARMVWTDPPYGVAYQGAPTTPRKSIKNDALALGALETLLTDALSNMLAHTEPGAVWYVAGPTGAPATAFIGGLRRLGVFRQTLIWCKDSMVLGWADFQQQHEGLYYGWTPGEAHRAPAARNHTTLWRFKAPSVSKDHPTMKPIDLIAHSLKLSSIKGDLVIDGFLGSGSTLMACELTGRRCCGVELDPLYADVIIRRWQARTGGLARREEDGVEFDDLQAACGQTARGAP